MSYETVNPPRARQLVDEGWIYVDVRTVEEHEAGRPTGAYNVPIAFRDMTTGRMQPNPGFVEVMARRFPRDAKLVLGCAVGGRSQMACEVLEAEGFEHLVNMHGGFSGARDPFGNVQEAGWESLGYPTESGPNDERGYDALRRP